MAIEKKELLNHYKIVQEYFYHHDTINMQIYMAFGIVISLFLTAIGLIFSRDFPLRQEDIYAVLTKVAVLVMFVLILFFFYQAIRDRAKTFEEYAKRMQIIIDSEELKEERNKCLLFETDLCKTRKRNEQRLWCYGIFSFIVSIALVVFLFGFLS